MATDRFLMAGALRIACPLRPRILRVDGSRARRTRRRAVRARTGDGRPIDGLLVLVDALTTQGYPVAVAIELADEFELQQLRPPPNRRHAGSARRRAVHEAPRPGRRRRGLRSMRDQGDQIAPLPGRGSAGHGLQHPPHRDLLGHGQPRRAGGTSASLRRPVARRRRCSGIHGARGNLWTQHPASRLPPVRRGANREQVRAGRWRTRRAQVLPQCAGDLAEASPSATT